MVHDKNMTNTSKTIWNGNETKFVFAPGGTDVCRHEVDYLLTDGEKRTAVVDADSAESARYRAWAVCARYCVPVSAVIAVRVRL
jgi:hypothetical protein